jgi:hypothetical protein
MVRVPYFSSVYLLNPWEIWCYWFGFFGAAAGLLLRFAVDPERRVPAASERVSLESLVEWARPGFEADVSGVPVGFDYGKCRELKSSIYERDFFPLFELRF